MNTQAKMDTSQKSEDLPTTGPGGHSGKRVALGVVVLLISFGMWLAYSLYVYGQIDEARDQTQAAWRNLVNELDLRYRQAERLIASGVDQGEIDMRLGEQFRLSVDRFRTTAQPPVQVEAARELEQQLSQVAGVQPPSDSLRHEVRKFNDCLAEENKVLSSPGGRFLSIFLQFEEPRDFEVN